MRPPAASLRLQVYDLRKQLQAAGLPVQRCRSITLEDVLQMGGLQPRRGSDDRGSGEQQQQQQQQQQQGWGGDAAGQAAAGAAAAPDSSAAAASCAQLRGTAGAGACSSAASIGSAAVQQPEDSALGHGGSRPEVCFTASGAWFRP
jgi:hypothetical protein